jgi:enolase-phosphatase E1
VDASLHGQRRGPELRAGLLGSPIHSSANGGEVALVSPIDASQIRVILLDIEGTTTSIDFVYKMLFPYASRKLESFLRERAQSTEIRSILQELHEQHQQDERDGLQPPAWLDDTEEARLRSSVAYGQWLIARDSKCTPLKSLEGKIWQQGFTNGELRGQVFPDVSAAFERWRRQKKTICIYSSGSVLAQQNLFRTTAYGDLTAHISVFFDTRVGSKTDSESYSKIIASFSLAPQQFLFISDVVKEIEAARSVGMQTLLCERDPRPSAPSSDDDAIHTFDNVLPD